MAAENQPETIPNSLQAVSTAAPDGGNCLSQVIIFDQRTGKELDSQTITVSCNGGGEYLYQGTTASLKPGEYLQPVQNKDSGWLSLDNAPLFILLAGAVAATKLASDRKSRARFVQMINTPTD